MKLRLGQPVHSSDGLFGELGDIVIDPAARKVTHIVVEAHEQHSQARLVPIWLVSNEVDDVLLVALSARFVRQLQRVAFDDFLTADPTTVDDELWDVGTEAVIASPYWRSGDVSSPEAARRSAERVPQTDRVPKAQCEIRRRSEVTTADYHLVGHVEGLVAENDDLIAVVVVTGVPGRRNHVVVPMSSVANVFNKEILLCLDRREFAALPRTAGLALPKANDEHGLQAIRSTTSRLARRALHRRHRRDPDGGGQ